MAAVQQRQQQQQHHLFISYGLCPRAPLLSRRLAPAPRDSKLAAQHGAQQSVQLGVQQGVQQSVQQGVQLGVQQGVQQGAQQGVQQSVQQSVRLGVQQSAQQGAQQTRSVVLHTPGPKTSDAVSLAFIHPNLYLTSRRGAEWFEGPVAIVAVCKRKETDYLHGHRAAFRAHVNVDDTLFMSYAHFAAAFGEAADLLKKALDCGDCREQGCRRITLLHCHMGINRSVATALAYVLKYTTLEYAACLRQIRAANATHRALPALSNITFQRHLARFAQAVRNS